MTEHAKKDRKHNPRGNSKISLHSFGPFLFWGGQLYCSSFTVQYAVRVFASLALIVSPLFPRRALRRVPNSLIFFSIPPATLQPRVPVSPQSKLFPAYFQLNFAAILAIFIIRGFPLG